MTRQDALTLVDYHYWARDRMIEAIEALTPEQYAKDLGSSFKSVRDTVVHTYGAEWNWYERWVGHSPTAFPDVTMFPDVAALRTAWKTQERNVRLLVDALASANELDRVFKYRTFDGQETESVFSHMLQHVVNHATFHRGQVTTLLRQLGAPAPKPQDLIRFYRERATRVH
jgi:uncharacterized damage-inducible protein DinB